MPIAKPRPHANLTSAPKACARMMADKSRQYQGFCNSATWTFSIYFLQERDNYEAMVALIRKAREGKGLTDYVYQSAKRMMERVYNAGRMEPLDGDEVGQVNVREIVDTLAEEVK